MERVTKFLGLEALNDEIGMATRLSITEWIDQQMQPIARQITDQVMLATTEVNKIKLDHLSYEAKSSSD